MMKRETVEATFATLAALGTAAILLPDIDKAWQHIPQQGRFNAQMRSGQVSFVALAVALGALQSSIASSPVPIAVSILLALYVCGLYEVAYQTPADGS